MPGIGLVDLRTVRGEGRLIGDVEITVELSRAQMARRRARRPSRALRITGVARSSGPRTAWQVVHGFGMTAPPARRGVRRGWVIGTYLHGPLLPKNTWFCRRAHCPQSGVVPEQLPAIPDTF